MTTPKPTRPRCQRHMSAACLFAAIALLGSGNHYPVYFRPASVFPDDGY